MAKVPNGVETLPKISITWAGRTNVTDDRQTDRRAMTYSEHEHEFTFAKNCILLETKKQTATWSSWSMIVELMATKTHKRRVDIVTLGVARTSWSVLTALVAVCNNTDRDREIHRHTQTHWHTCSALLASEATRTCHIIRARNIVYLNAGRKNRREQSENCWLQYRQTATLLFKRHQITCGIDCEQVNVCSASVCCRRHRPQVLSVEWVYGNGNGKRCSINDDNEAITWRYNSINTELPTWGKKTAPNYCSNNFVKPSSSLIRFGTHILH